MDYIFTIFPCFIIKEAVLSQINVCLIITNLKQLKRHLTRNAVPKERAD